MREELFFFVLAMFYCFWQLQSCLPRLAELGESPSPLSIENEKTKRFTKSCLYFYFSMVHEKQSNARSLYAVL